MEGVDILEPDKSKFESQLSLPVVIWHQAVYLASVSLNVDTATFPGKLLG